MNLLFTQTESNSPPKLRPITSIGPVSSWVSGLHCESQCFKIWFLYRTELGSETV
ncbi:hypothetical protein HanRHA438_Chr15g0695681 [Helianthus annuus]|nr:hypothetical protein HanIR_Chr15g0742491 [Helianthus annuus]KAJ0843827.1 hypothetical protein HanRHA438_Chr15g0695681 [Helianthus annuus]